MKPPHRTSRASSAFLLCQGRDECRNLRPEDASAVVCPEGLSGMRRLRMGLRIGLMGLALWGNTVWAAGPLTTGADFLLVTTGARPDAMGQAFSAIADDINTLSFNPAGLGNIRLPEVGYGRYEFVSDIHFDFIGLAAPLGKPGVLGLGFIGMGTPPFNSTRDTFAPNVSARETALIVGWGRSFERLHAGASFKYISRSIGVMRGKGVLADLGLRYRLKPSITLAASMLNFGPRIRLDEKEDTPAAFKFGSAWRILNHPLHSFDLAMDIGVPLTSQKPRYGWGAEYWYHDFFAGRVGFIGNTVDEGLTAGCGFKFQGFEIDYAYQPFNRLGVTHRVSGLYRWRGEWLSGNEPNPPRYPKIKETDKGTFLSWEKPIGPYKAFEVTVKPLDRAKNITLPQVLDSPIKLKGIRKDVLYKITIRTVGKGGRKSFPSQPVYYEYSPAEFRPAQVAQSTLSPVVEAQIVQTVEPTPVPTMEAQPVQAVEPTPVPTVEEEPVQAVEPTPVPTVEEEPVQAVEPTPVPTVEAEPVQAAEPTPVPTVEAEPVQAAEPTPVPTVEAQPVQKTEPTPSPVEEAEISPAVEKESTKVEKMAPSPASVSKKVWGTADMVGLHLQWDAAADDQLQGYNLYVKLPSGAVKKLNEQPKKRTEVWIPQPIAWEGSKWIVAAVSGSEGEGTETVIGSFLWYPTRKEIDLILSDPQLNLNVSSQASGKFFLDWDKDGDADDYSFFAAKKDGVYEWYGYIERKKPWALIDVNDPSGEYHFIVVSHDSAKAMLKKTKVDTGKIHRLKDEAGKQENNE